MNAQIEKEGKKKPPPPICWFNFTVVNTGDKVRVGFSGEFIQALGSHAGKIVKEAQQISRLKGNPQAGITETALRGATVRLDKEVKEITGYSYSELERDRHEKEVSLNSSLDPASLAKKMGLDPIREIPSGSQPPKGTGPDVDKFFGIFGLEPPRKKIEA